MQPVIYCARNLLNGSEYIGVTSGGVKKRKREHFFAARHGSRLRFHRAIRKYGEENFEFIEIEKCSDYESALRREVEIIRERSPKYNLTVGGEGIRGFRMPREIVERLAAGNRTRPGPWRGKRRDPETVEKIRAAKRKNPQRFWLGKKRSQETIEKIIKAKTGVPRKPPAPEVLAIFIENMRKASEAKRKKVKCIDDGLVFACAGDAAKYYGFKRLSVNRVCNADGKRRSLFGKRFEYIDGAP